MKKVLLLLCLISYLKGHTQVSYLDLTGLSNANSITARPIGATGVTFDASITNTGSVGNPNVTSNGSIAFKTNSGTTQCLNLTFSQGAEVYISDNISHNGITVNGKDRFTFSNLSYLKTDPSNRINITTTGGVVRFVPKNNIKNYTTWSLKFAPETSIQICARRHTAIPSNNLASAIRIGVITATLPIELLNFDAVIFNESQVKINWQTTSEINNDYFLIERSQNGLDWEELEIIEGAGNSSTLLSYTINDEAPFQGVSYYRLKQVDFNGDYTYSNIVPINFFGIEIIQGYPNPTDGIISIIVNSTVSSELIANIYNIEGKLVTTYRENLVRGFNTFKFDFTNLPNGLYHLRTSTSDYKYYDETKIKVN